jgi:hypothetical protein
MTTIKGRVIAESAAVLVARVQDASGNNLTTASVSTMTVKVFSLNDDTLTVTLPDTATTVFDTLQLDGRWTQDSLGYNVAISVDGTTAWPSAGPYRVECEITPVTGSPFFLLWELQATRVFST